MSLRATHDKVGGQRTGLLLLEAPGEAAPGLDAIASRLVQAGFQVIRLQPAGTVADGAGGWQDWYADAETALAQMRASCDVIIAGGVGRGAALALLLAAKHPQIVHATAHFAPALWLTGRLAPWAAGLVCLALGRWAAETIGISPCLARKLGVPGESLAEQRRLLQAARRELKAIRQPALIVHAREDRCAGLDSAGYLQRYLQGLVDMVVLGPNRPVAGSCGQHAFVVEKVRSFAENVARRRQSTVVPVRARAASPAPAILVPAGQAA